MYHNQVMRQRVYSSDTTKLGPQPVGHVPLLGHGLFTIGLGCVSSGRWHSQPHSCKSQAHAPTAHTNEPVHRHGPAAHTKPSPLPPAVPRTQKG